MEDTSQIVIPTPSSPASIYSATYDNLFAALTPAMKERVLQVKADPNKKDRDVSEFAQKVIEVAEIVIDQIEREERNLESKKVLTVPQNS